MSDLVRPKQRLPATVRHSAGGRSHAHWGTVGTVTLTGGFYSPEHEANFRAARDRTNRGGAESAICGARTRVGGVCRQPPLRGARRCLRHAGPIAARAHRERQLHDLALGRISFEAFSRSEAKRALNRLRWQWKKNPWLPGQTIDLGVFEARFQADSGTGRLAFGVRVPPSVLDWLRWRYRRLQIDRKRDEEWLRVLREDYPRRVRDAGTPPLDTDGRSLRGDVPAPFWRTDRPTSRRQRLDAPRAAFEPQPRQLRERKMPNTLDKNALGLMVAQYRDILAPLLDKCRSETEQRTLILALHEYLADPAEMAAGARWRDAVNELWSR